MINKKINFLRYNKFFSLLVDTHDKGFSKDICRSMVAMLDIDHSGKLGFEEFKTLWNDIRKWRVSLRNCYIKLFILRI